MMSKTMNQESADIYRASGGMGLDERYTHLSTSREERQIRRDDPDSDGGYAIGTSAAPSMRGRETVE